MKVLLFSSSTVTKTVPTVTNRPTGAHEYDVAAAIGPLVSEKEETLLPVDVGGGSNEYEFMPVEVQKRV